MKHIKIARHILLGSMGIVLINAFSGCQSSSTDQAEMKKEESENSKKILVVEQQADGKYVVVEEIPTSGESRAIIREKDENGNVHERIMTEAEMKDLAQQEYTKMQSGQSELNNEPKGEGMGLGGTILAAAAGALLGNVIGNALMNNSTFRKHQETSNRSAFYRSSAPSSHGNTASQKKSFFGNSSPSRTNSSFSGFGG